MKSIEEIRETSKLGLETFFLYFDDNSFNRISDESISAFKIKIEDAKARHKNSQYQSFDYFGTEQEIYFLNEELRAISEMKIVYAYKNFEIKLKYLLNAAYKESNHGRKLFQWQFVLDFLTSKNINPKMIDGFTEVDELRNVNNSIKHFDNLLLDKTTLNIKEFKNRGSITYVQLLDFYNRVQSFPSNFIESLANLIYQDLYIFNEEKFEKMADDLAIRMTKNDADKFIEVLKTKY